MFNLSRFYRFHRLFAGQAFESNGGVSVTVMDGEEMVGRMADQVLILSLDMSCQRLMLLSTEVLSQ